MCRDLKTDSRKTGKFAPNIQQKGRWAALRGALRGSERLFKIWRVTSVKPLVQPSQAICSCHSPCPIPTPPSPPPPTPNLIPFFYLWAASSEPVWPLQTHLPSLLKASCIQTKISLAASTCPSPFLPALASFGFFSGPIQLALSPCLLPYQEKPLHPSGLVINLTHPGRPWPARCTFVPWQRNQYINK